MFEQTFLATQQTKRDRAIACALIAQAVLVTGIGLLPLLAVEPLGQVKQFLIMPPPGVPTHEPPNPGPKSTAAPTHRILILRPVARLAVGRTPVEMSEPGIPSLSTNDSTVGPVGIGLPMPDLTIARPAPAPKPEPKQPPRTVRLTSTIAQSQLTYGPHPAYPHLAVISRVEGTVKLQAIISREGKIDNLHLVSGPALLVNAAMDAVRTWRYRPLLLNGEPVEVITEIDVIFTLQR